MCVRCMLEWAVSHIIAEKLVERKRNTHQAVHQHIRHTQPQVVKRLQTHDYMHMLSIE